MNTQLLIEFFKVCIDAQRDTLKLHFDYSPVHKSVSLHYSIGGDNELRQLFCVETNFKLAIQMVIDLTKQHDKLYAPENLAATQEANRLAKIAELQKQIEDLENKDERFLKQAQGRSVRNNAGK